MFTGITDVNTVITASVNIKTLILAFSNVSHCDT